MRQIVEETGRFYKMLGVTTSPSICFVLHAVKCYRKQQLPLPLLFQKKYLCASIRELLRFEVRYCSLRRILVTASMGLALKSLCFMNLSFFKVLLLHFFCKLSLQRRNTWTPPHHGTCDKLAATSYAMLLTDIWTFMQCNMIYVNETSNLSCLPYSSTCNIYASMHGQKTSDLLCQLLSYSVFQS